MEPMLPAANECLACGGSMTVRHETVDLLALPGVKLEGIAVYQCDCCQEREVEIPRLPELLSLVAELVAKVPRRLKPEEFRFLRKHLGWSQLDAARNLLGSRAHETISRWEAGAQSIQYSAEQLLRYLALSGTQEPNYRLQHIETGTDGEPNFVLARSELGLWRAKDEERALDG